MRTCALALLLALGVASCEVLPVYAGALDNVTDTSWLQQSALKWGYLGSMSGYGLFTGIVESAKYSGERISTSGDNYHVMRYGQQVTGLTSGYTLYATIKDRHLSRWGKAGRITEGVLVHSLAYDMAYRWNRTGNPFCYDPDYTFNQKTIVGIGFRGGKLVDLYIGTDYITGPIYDGLRFALAAYLHGKIR